VRGGSGCVTESAAVCLCLPLSSLNLRFSTVAAPELHISAGDELSFFAPKKTSSIAPIHKFVHRILSQPRSSPIAAQSRSTRHHALRGNSLSLRLRCACHRSVCPFFPSATHR
jgi:hypothetical protein